MHSDKFSYFYKNTIYYYNANNNTYDSLYIDPLKFSDTGTPVWENNTNGPLTLLIIGAGVLLLLSILAIRKRNNKHEKFSLDSIKDFKINFNDTEITLIQLLISKLQKNKKATIAELNYVLGLKDKNIGLQKKVRSDVINSVNSKYKYFLKKDIQLIQSIRSESDKRYFEYFIESSELNSIQKILKDLND